MVNLTWKDKSIFRRGFVGCATVGLRAIISALVRRHIWVWPVSTIVIVMVIAGFLMIPQALMVNADDEQDSALEDCLSCHSKTLKGHDKLSSGNDACWLCHDSGDMKKLRLTDGSPLSLADSPKLCGQCHQERYGAWKEGTHGIPGTSDEKCTDCHDPHQPQIAFSNITKPHPEDQLSSSPPSFELLMMFGISLLLLIAGGIVVAMRGEGP